MGSGRFADDLTDAKARAGSVLELALVVFLDIDFDRAEERRLRCDKRPIKILEL